MLWTAWIACGYEGPELNGELTSVSDGADHWVYDDDGVACVSSGEGLEVLVDFGDCVACDERDLSCEVVVDGDRIVVTAGGTLSVSHQCRVSDTCESVSARCEGSPVPDGDYVLVYGDAEVEATLPSADWACTGPTGIL